VGTGCTMRSTYEIERVANCLNRRPQSFWRRGLGAARGRGGGGGGGRGLGAVRGRGGRGLGQRGLGAATARGGEGLERRAAGAWGGVGLGLRGLGDARARGDEGWGQGLGRRGLGAARAWGGEGLGRRGLVLSWKSPTKQRKRLAANQSDGNSEADTKIAGFCNRMDLAITECQTTSTIRDLADGRLGQHYPRPRRWTLGQHYPRPRRWTLGHYPRPRRWTPTQGMEDTRMKGHAWQLTLSRMRRSK